MVSTLLRTGAIALLVLGVGVGPAIAQEQMLLIQLNNAEQNDEGCTIAFVVNNRSNSTFEVLGARLEFFDLDGVVSYFSTVSFGKLRPNERNVRRFLFPSLVCDTVGEVLIDEFAQCQMNPPRDIDCLDVLAVDYKGPIALVK